MCATTACQYTVGTSRRGDIVLRSRLPRKCRYPLFAYPLFKRAQIYFLEFGDVINLKFRLSVDWIWIISLAPCHSPQPACKKIQKFIGRKTGLHKDISCKFSFCKALQDYNLKLCGNLICNPVWSNGYSEQILKLKVQASG